MAAWDMGAHRKSGLYLEPPRMLSFRLPLASLLDSRFTRRIFFRPRRERVHRSTNQRKQRLQIRKNYDAQILPVKIKGPIKKDL